MNTHQTDDWLDKLLTEQSDYIDDHGFTQQVMSSLPKKKNYAQLRAAILSIFSVLACIVGFIILPGAEFLVNGLAQLTNFKSFSSVHLLVLIPIALLYWGAITAAVNEK